MEPLEQRSLFLKIEYQQFAHERNRLGVLIKISKSRTGRSLAVPIPLRLDQFHYII